MAEKELCAQLRQQIETDRCEHMQLAKRERKLRLEIMFESPLDDEKVKEIGVCMARRLELEHEIRGAERKVRNLNAWLAQ
jgi:hypothetical protein